MIFIRQVKVADDIGPFRIHRDNFWASMKQPTRLIKIDRMGNVSRDADISLARFGNNVHLDGEQHRDMLPLQRPGQQDGLRSTPAVSKDDDSRLPSLQGGEDAVTVGVQKSKDVVQRLLSGVIAEHLYIDGRSITVAQTRRKLHLSVLRIVVLHEATNEPDNDHFVEGRVCYWKRRRQAA